MARLPPSRQLLRTSLRQLRTYSSQPQSSRTLLPSVLVLLHANKIPESDVPKIPATGPNGRLLKGDVLAYLGRIPASYPAEQSQALTKLSHLDLSNIKVASPPPAADAAPTPSAAAAAEPATEPPTHLAVPISLAPTLAFQQRLRDSLGVTLPLATLIARAVDLANASLPRRRGPPSPDELFDAVLGASTVRAEGTPGNFVPDLLVPPPRAAAAGRRARSADIIDELTASVDRPARAAAAAEEKVDLGLGTAPAENVFSVTVEAADRERGESFLARMKIILEEEPGRLVL